MQSLSAKLRNVPLALCLTLAVCLLFPALTYGAAPKKKFVVVVDAGHGGNDTGAIENGVNEKDVNLAVALKLGQLISKKLKDTEVIYTRNTDKFISLQGRANIANNAKADIFISIHCNSVDRNNKNRTNVVGATTYVLGHHKDNDNLQVAKRENAVVELDADDSAHFSEFDPSKDESYIIFEMGQKKSFQNSIRLASDIQKEMEEAGRVSRGVQQAGFYVLWSTAMPSVLVELDFLCNPDQAQYLNSAEGQDQLAESIFNAVKKYEAYYRKNLGTDSSDSGKNVTATATATAVAAATPAESISDEELAAIVAKYGAPDTSSEASMEESVATASETAVTESPKEVDLSDYSEASERRRSRETASSATSSSRKTGSGSHRRRSSAARTEGESQVQRSAPSTEVVETAAVDSKSEAREDKGSKDKKENKADASKPARRDKDSKSHRKAVKHSGTTVKFKILLFVSENELKANDDAFKGLAPVSCYKENNKYNYTYGESSDRNEMEALLIEVSELFPDARVIKNYQ